MKFRAKFHINRLHLYYVDFQRVPDKSGQLKSFSMKLVGKRGSVTLSNKG